MTAPGWGTCRKNAATYEAVAKQLLAVAAQTTINSRLPRAAKSRSTQRPSVAGKHPAASAPPFFR
ncbi:hypothetical protein [Paenarthrobacter sp. FR1]|uniref:hypothetical protein n=1 Tax=Paenarthrobacter sp. FR1 TaxID=3439548 RepID=UPI003DA3D286